MWSFQIAYSNKFSEARKCFTGAHDTSSTLLACTQQAMVQPSSYIHRTTLRACLVRGVKV
jgi:hypothetical protein